MQTLSLLKRIPLPAILGALVAISSYVVASIWKQEYDTTINHLRGYSQEILTVRNTTLVTSISKAVLYNSEDQISTMRMLVVAFKAQLPQQAAALLDDSLLYVVSPTNNMARWEISTVHNAALANLLHPPNGGSDLEVKLDDYVKLGWFAGIDDLKACVKENDTSPGAVFSVELGKRLRTSDRATKVSDVMSVQSFAKLMADRFDSVRAAEQTILVPAVVAVMESRPEAAVSSRTLWEVIDAKCFDDFRVQHDKLLTLVLTDLRQQIDQEVIPKYERRRNWLQTAEVALYILGLLIALAKQAPVTRSEGESQV